MAAYTGAQIKIFRLLSLKHQLKLERLGLHSSGGAIRPRIAEEFGLTPRARREAFITAIDAKIAKILKEE